MAKAGLLFVGTNDGIALYSEPGAMGRWLRVGQELRGFVIQSIWVWADNPLHVVATTDTQLYRSIDGGGSWEVVIDVPGGMLAGSRAAQAQVVCLTHDGVLWRSSDAGANWSPTGNIEGVGSSLVATAGDSSNIVTIATGKKVSRSVDGGTTWELLPELPANVEQIAMRMGEYGLCVVAQQQLFSYHENSWQLLTPHIVVAGGFAILGGREPELLVAESSGKIARSSDAGMTWKYAANDLAWDGPPNVIIAASYHIDTAFAGDTSMVALSTDRGNTWQRLKGDLAGVRAIAAARLV